MAESEFTKGVVRVVRSVPFGRVVSYGQVAVYLGFPRAARGVGWVLRQTKREELPWWRVVNNAGRISIKNWEHPAEEQRERLRSEGVEVGEDFSLEIEKYRFQAGEELLKSWGLPEEYVRMVEEKFGGYG